MGRLSFWDFVRERHAIYLRRQAGAAPPWTTDPVLANYHFTNVYRELDPGTVFIREQLQKNRDATLREKVLNLAVYRLCLHERSYSALGWLSLPCNSHEFARRLHEIPEPFHGAYYIHNLGLSIPKADAMAKVADHLIEHMEQRGLDATTRAGFIRNLSMVKGIGGFIATQVLADLCYDLHVGLPQDGYVALGPGAMKGLALVAGRDLQETAAQAVLEDLWREQPPVGGPHLTRMNIQNCCCEFSKYNGHPRRRFRAAQRAGATQGGLFE